MHCRVAGLVLILLVFFSQGCSRSSATRVGSKVDVETVTLGEMATLLIRDAGAEVEHLRQLGGTPVLWNALQSGAIDVYADYTGTITRQLLRDAHLANDAEIRAVLAPLGIGMTGSLGFQNNYALGMRAREARQRGIRKLSDLTQHPDLRLGFSSEFMQRQDGWPGLRRAYDWPNTSPLSLDHTAAYEGLLSGRIDVTDVYTTDAEIERFDLQVLVDDRGYFPAYAAVFLYRSEWAKRHPDLLAAVQRLEGRISETDMIALNCQAQDRVPESRIAALFLGQRLGLRIETASESTARLLLRLTGEHLTLVGLSLLAAIVTAIPLGMLAADRPRLGHVLLAGTGLIQTIPALALLVFMIPLPFVGGLGARPAIVALYLYSLLPILRNTYTGLIEISPSLRESAEALGLSRTARWQLIELPLASRSILAGVKTAAVINVGTATLGALIGAGGYGQLIQEGLRLNDRTLILLGAVPAALLALTVQAVFEGLDRWMVPAGLRLRGEPPK